MPFTILDQGSFTQGSTATSRNINLPASCDYFRAVNLTQMATTQTPGRGVVFEWFGDGLVAADAAIETLKADGANTLQGTVVSSGGFTYVESRPSPEAAVTGTAITAANPPVVSMVNTYSNGDRVRLYNTTGMLQIGGMEFTISNVSGTDFELLGLPATGFAAPATAVTARRVPKFAPVEPEFLYVTSISQASQAVVTVSVDHNYVVGQLIHFSVPSSFGMTEIDQLTGKIVAINTADRSPYVGYGFTVDIDTSGFSSFAFPASTASPNARLFATVSPAGQRTQRDPNLAVSDPLYQTGYNFDEVPFRTGKFYPYMHLAAGAQSPAGSASDVIAWQAFKAE